MLESVASNDHKGKIIVYRARFEKLLAVPKPLRDQLIIELPTLQAFRTGEITTLRAEDVDLESGDIEVLDSKKHRYYTLPLNLTLAMHLSEYMQQTGKNGKDYLITPLPHAHRKQRKPGSKTRGVSISEETVTWIWKRNSELCGLPHPLTPREGRAYFAARWHFLLKKSIYHLKVAMRHDHIDTTVYYLSRIVDQEDFKVEFHQNERDYVSECNRSAQCPVAIEGCRCRMFQPQVTLSKAQLSCSS